MECKNQIFTLCGAMHNIKIHEKILKVEVLFINLPMLLSLI